MDNTIFATLNVFSLYAQIEIVDVESGDGIPEWETGNEALIFDTHGVRIATKPDSDIEIIVSNYQIMEDPVLCVSGSIQIGNKGLFVGNTIASTIVLLDIESGIYKLVIFTNGLGSEVTRVNVVVR